VCSSDLHESYSTNGTVGNLQVLTTDADEIVVVPLRGSDSTGVLSLLELDSSVKFTEDFTQTVKNAGMKTNPLPKGSLNLNGRCEPFIDTIKLECLAKFIVSAGGISTI
jgi:hypothetical protein